MTRTLAKDASSENQKQITAMGWVNSRRDHGGLIFIDLRDESGILQLTIHPEQKEVFAVAEGARDEYVLKATGTIRKRDEGLVNKNIVSGDVELVVESLTVLNKSEALPIQINSEQNVSEDVRLKYRFLDLRREKMQGMLKKRAEYMSFMRSFMERNEFTEVSTPILANSSPEGARDFLIPSRLHPGTFYALPQAPQQFKQLLMVGGVPRYYQMAVCFRDEDPRADRLFGDFYQLDLEMSFIEDGQQVRDTMTPLIESLVTDFAGKKLTFPEGPKILTHYEAAERYGSDKPDLRYGMELTDVSDVFKDTEFGVFKNALSNGGVIKTITVENAASLSRKQIDGFTDIAKSEGAGGLAYIMVDEAEELTGPIVKFFSEAELSKLKEVAKAKAGDGIFFGVDMRSTVNKVLGKLRTSFASHFELASNDEVALAWVIDFPFYETDEKSGELEFGHNPFSMPKGGLEALSSDSLSEITADQYDMVMNGYEICSGAIRNHSPEIMYKAFGNLGFDQEYVDEKFGGMINAFKFGAPPHGGCAFGIDRMFMILVDEENIREIIAFPKNGSGVDVMMQSPSKVDEKTISELSIKTDLKED